MEQLPKGCFSFLDHKRIIRKDINGDRPFNQCHISTERALSHRRLLKERPKIWFFRKNPYWVVFSTTTYEMSGDYHDSSMGGSCWAETDMTGLEWHFYNKNDALDFVLDKS
jgi:hypothetical protein